ncbi:hypothetical protein C362_02079 [Cryptococcus neoformans Bt1]|nr:hypothetical protein C362_02079 [Cryptococcus neoformans var. grubii Bt1]OXG28514.1 hypothetical protein C367_02380 [Cryptococcus neoformans var. grubii Ze90-1]
MSTSTEMRALLEQRAWHSTELGLHKEATASLYAPHEQMGLWFSAFYYSDIFRAFPIDLKPCIPLSEIDTPDSPPRPTRPSLAPSPRSYTSTPSSLPSSRSTPHGRRSSVWSCAASCLSCVTNRAS